MSTHYITRSNQTTRSAEVFSVGERLAHCGSADACLTRTARVYLDQIAPSVFGLVRNLSEKASPCSIVNRLGEHAASQAFDIQVFDNNRSEILNQPERQTMLQLVPLIPDSSVNFLEQRNRFAPTLRAFLAARNLSLRSTKTRLSLLIETRIRNRRIVSECREVFEAHINSDCVVERRQRFGFAFDREADVPLAARALHRDGLNLARNGAVQFHFDYSDALHAEHVAVQADAIAVTGKRNAVEATRRFESRIARFFVTLHAAEERLEGFVHAAENILAARKVRQTQITRSADFLQLIRLRVVVDGDALFPRSAAFLQSTIVQAAGFAQLLVECFRLEACRE